MSRKTKAQLVEEVSDLRAQLRMAETEDKEHAQEARNLGDRVVKLEGRIDALQSECSILERENGRLESNLRDQTKRVGLLEEHARMLQEMITSTFIS